MLLPWRRGRLLLLRWVVVARLGLRLWLLLRWVLVAGLLGVVRGGLLRIIGRGLLRVVRRSLLLTWIGVQAVGTALAIGTGWRGFIAGGVLAIEQAAHHFAHAVAKLGQKLQRIFILLRLLILRLVIGRLLILWLRLGVLRLLRVTTLWLLIVALLLGHGGRCQADGETPAQYP